MGSEAAREFDLDRGPLLRALVAGADEESALLLLTACAACADANSLLLLLGELCERYRGAEAAEEPIQYADYAEWRHELIAGEEPEARDGLAFWREDAADRPSPATDPVRARRRGRRRATQGRAARAARGRARGAARRGRRRRRHGRRLPRGGVARAARAHVRESRSSLVAGWLRRAIPAGPRRGDRCLRTARPDPFALPGGDHVRGDPRPGAALARDGRALAGLRRRRGPARARRARRRRLRVLQRRLRTAPAREILALAPAARPDATDARVPRRRDRPCGRAPLRPARGRGGRRGRARDSLRDATAQRARRLRPPPIDRLAIIEAAERQRPALGVRRRTRRQARRRRSTSASRSRRG